MSDIEEMMAKLVKLGAERQGIRHTDWSSSLAAPTGSAPSLTREQRDILDHTRHRAAGGHYCGGGKDMDALMQMGLMESHGSFLGNQYFGITAEGVKALRAQNSAMSDGDVEKLES